MDELITFVDDLEIERQVPLFSFVSYELDKEAFLTDALEEAKRKESAKDIIGPNYGTSRIIAHHFDLDFRVDGDSLGVVITYHPSMRMPRTESAHITELSSPDVIPELIEFIDGFMNVHLVHDVHFE
jgi:hypothetical protein